MREVLNKFNLRVPFQLVEQRLSDGVDGGCRGADPLCSKEFLEKTPYPRVLRWVGGRAGSQRQPAVIFIDIDDFLRDAFVG